MSEKLIFVTGNANKLKEVRAILASGPQAIEIDSQELDIPEVQGTTQEVAIAKCKRAAELVRSMTRPLTHAPTNPYPRSEDRV
ncbi:hypothetical protein ONZ45_g3407 [Pleurotus djamor]|nr:hypothetical protein ONZ45_g3407 [Pleurotus djamor]